MTTRAKETKRFRYVGEPVGPLDHRHERGGGVKEQRAFEHDGSGIAEAITWLGLQAQGDVSRLRVADFVARVLVQIPDPRRHLVRYYGAYSNRARGRRRKAEGQLEGTGSSEAEEHLPPPPERAALLRRWANLIRRVYEVDPLVCPRCGAEMRVVGFITESSLIKRILDHLRKRKRASRAPPQISPPVVGQPAACPV